MSTHVREFEVAFAEKVDAPFAVMCNSGSSANLLAFAAAVEPCSFETDRTTGRRS